ncbi:MAG: HAMP domain-containing protein [Rhodospirillaceae bacterium]|nr:HAMP domain-containing protein [Rhodospirillaceae bacterium]
MLRRFLPDSIFTWLLLILVTAVVASQAVTMLLHNLNRNEILLHLEDQRAAERVAALATFLDHTAPILRAGVADAMSGPSLAVRVTSAPAVAAREPSRELMSLAALLAERLSSIRWREIRVGSLVPMQEAQAGSVLASGPVASDHLLVRIDIQLRDLTWLNFALPMMAELPWASPQLLGLTAGSLVAVLGLCLYALLRLTRPLARLTRAAEALGRASPAGAGGTDPLPESGVGEVRRAATAFNAMQTRITDLIEDRLQMIAAISHDLRTPITRLRLRAEFMADDEMRAKMLRDLDEMEAMIGDTLAFAREEGNPEPLQTFDLRNLLREAGEHQADMQLSVAGAGPWQITGQPLALKRAFANLIDNALAYGNAARVSLSRQPASHPHDPRRRDGFRIVIDDDGPGIPTAELARVFRPFYRLESSRNRDSGGTGLGLAIAEKALRAHGGEILLHNRMSEDGSVAGLRVEILLPARHPMAPSGAQVGHNH